MRVFQNLIDLLRANKLPAGTSQTCFCCWFHCVEQTADNKGRGFCSNFGATQRKIGAGKASSSQRSNIELMGEANFRWNFSYSVILGVNEMYYLGKQRKSYHKLQQSLLMRF